MKLNTVNVIECIDGSVISVSSFSDNEEGNREAESLFKACVASKGELQVDKADYYIEEGVFRHAKYDLYLVHSERRGDKAP